MVVKEVLSMQSLTVKIPSAPGVVVEVEVVDEKNAVEALLIVFLQMVDLAHPAPVG